MNKKIVISLIIGLMFFSFVSAIPNPASTYCGKSGYKFEINETERGQQGICIFPDGSKCDEWVYFCKCDLTGRWCQQNSYECDYPCKEFSCGKGGESSFITKCCEGLNEINTLKIYDAKCDFINMVGSWDKMCSDCGNDICEEWENKCNCQKDCKINFFQKVINWFKILFKPGIVLSQDKENKVKVEEKLILTNLLRKDPNHSGVKILIEPSEKTEFEYQKDDFINIKYYEMERDSDGSYTFNLTAPKVPGSYELVLMEFKSGKSIKTSFDLIVFGDIKSSDGALQVAERTLYLKKEPEEGLISNWNIIDKKINLLDSGWNVTLKVEYGFGCCSGCGPADRDMLIGCVAVCEPCGIKIVKGFYVIDREGNIEQEIIKEISCKGKEGLWFRSTTGNELCSVDWS